MLPNGIAIICTSQGPGFVSDIAIFLGNQRFHFLALKKSTDEVQGVGDFGTLQEEHPWYWEVLMDKGYQGSAELSRECTPDK